MRVIDAVEQDLVYVHDEEHSLPDGWKVTTLEGLISDGGLFCDGDWVESKDQDPNGDVRLIQLADIGVAFYRDRSDRYLASERASALSCTFLQRGDVLVARMPDPLGRACLFPGDKLRAVTVVDVAVIRPNNPEVDSRWLMHRINSMAFRNAVASLQSGSTRLRISRRNLSRIAFPLPPLAQQLVVVDELEKQFSRLDEAVANLQRVKANLKRYNASVLKSAVEGHLVETEAALTHREGRAFETGEQLMQRILAQRREKWAGKGKYKEPVGPNLENISVLPQGWSYASIDQLAYVDVGFAFKSAEFASEGIRLLRGENIEPGKLRWAETRYWPESRRANFKSLLLAEGEIILAMDRPLVSAGLKLARVRASDLPCLLVQRVARLRCVDKAMESYLHSCMSTQVFERHLLDGQTGTQLPHVSGASIGAFVVPVPPASEQIRIAAEVDRHLSIIREVEAEVDTNLKRAQALRQATLQRAFPER